MGCKHTSHGHGHNPRQYIRGLDGYTLPGGTWEGLEVPAELACGVPTYSHYKALVSGGYRVLCTIGHQSWMCSGFSAQGQVQGEQWVQGLLLTAKAGGEGSVHFEVAVL